MSLMAVDVAIKLLEREAHANKDNFDNVDRFLGHSYKTGEKAKEIAEKLSLNPEELALAGYFHDIGRCFSKDQKEHTFHEIVGARFIEGEGIGLEVTDSQEQCNRIAQSFRSHFIVYEQFKMPEYSQWLPGLRDTNPVLLLPSSWNELIIVYADLTNINGEEVNFEERMDDIKERDKRRGSPRLKAVKSAESRLLTLKRDLEYALQNSKVDVNKYCIT